jgi:hypothetical protein
VQAAQYKTPFVAVMRILGIRALDAHTNAAKNLRLGLDTFKTSPPQEIESGD